MTINTTRKKMPTGNDHPTAGYTINDLDFPTTERRGKVFETLRACFAMKGHALYRSDPEDGAVTYWVERSGFVKQLPTMDAVRSFLASDRRR